MRTLARVVALVGVAVLCGGGSGGGCGGAGLGGVTVTATNQNPCVGQVVQLTATEFNAKGVAVAGVACHFSSNNPGVASVNQDSGAVTANASGVADIQATCDGQSGFSTINVSTCEVNLTITVQPPGFGSVMALPAGNGTLGTYNEGTRVILTETPVAGLQAVFLGWGGDDCNGLATTCTLTMDANKKVTATFGGPGGGTTGGGTSGGSTSGGTTGGSSGSSGAGTFCCFASFDCLDATITNPDSCNCYPPSDGPCNGAHTYLQSCSASYAACCITQPGGGCLCVNAADLTCLSETCQAYASNFGNGVSIVSSCP